MGMRSTLKSASCAALLCAAAMVAAQSASPSDKHFVKAAMQGSNAEIQLGQLAQQKGESEDVKHFGEKMVTDHSKLNEQMTPVAQNLDMTPPTDISLTDKALAAKLEPLSGTEFDNAYIKAMVKDHRKDAEEFRKQAKSATDPQVRQAAQQGLPVIEEHLRMAEQLAQDHHVTVASK